jgi:hypothetical protein
MKALALATGLMAGFFMPAYAEDRSPPDDVTARLVRMQIFCVGSMVRMATLLGDKFGEAPVAMGQLTDTDSFLIFVNKERSSSTIVIAKQRKEEVEVCMVWSGRTEPGLTFALNPSPQFPEPKAEGFGT